MRLVRYAILIFILCFAGHGYADTYTWNPDDKDVNVVLSNGDLTGSFPGSGYGNVRALFSKSTGKWYWECTIGSEWNGSSRFASVGIGTIDAGLTYGVGFTNYGWGYKWNGEKFHNNSSSGYGDAPSANKVLGTAINLDTGKVWWSLDCVWQASGDPAAGTNSAFTDADIASNAIYPMAMFSGDGVETPSITAVFEPASSMTCTLPTGFNALLLEYEITVTQADNGTISPGTDDVEAGATPTYTITPNSGYYITDVLVDSVSQPDAVISGSYQFSAVTAAHTITATYAAHCPTLKTENTAASTIITRARLYLDEPTGIYWTDDELLVWLNTGTMNIFARGKVLECSESVDLSMGTVEYTLSENYIDITEVVYVSASSTLKGLIRSVPSSVGHATAVGEPSYFYKIGNKLGVFPATTTASKTATVYYLARPAAIAIDDNVLVPAHYENALSLYIAARAWIKMGQYSKVDKLTTEYYEELDRFRIDYNERGKLPRESVK